MKDIIIVIMRLAAIWMLWQGAFHLSSYALFMFQEAEMNARTGAFVALAVSLFFLPAAFFWRKADWLAAKVLAKPIDETVLEKALPQHWLQLPVVLVGLYMIGVAVVGMGRVFVFATRHSMTTDPNLLGYALGLAIGALLLCYSGDIAKKLAKK